MLGGLCISVVAMSVRAEACVARSEAPAPSPNMERYLKLADIFTVVAVVISAIILAAACWLAIRVAKEMSGSENKHELQERIRCVRQGIGHRWAGKKR